MPLLQRAAQLLVLASVVFWQALVEGPIITGVISCTAREDGRVLGKAKHR